MLPPRHAFSLIELLVVMAVIAILAAMLLATMGTVKAVAHSAVCQSNLRQIGVAMEVYVQDYDRLPMPRYWGNSLYDEMIAGTGSLDRNTVKRCPARTGRTDQFGAAYAGRPAQYYGMNAKLAPDQGDQMNNAHMNKPVLGIALRPQAAVMLETMVSEQWGGAATVGFGFWLTRAGDLGRHRGGSNVLFADWHIESRLKALIPASRVTGDAVSWAFWTGTTPP